MPKETVRRKEIYRYEAPWTVYGMNWSIRQDKRFRLAIGSFVEDYCNKVKLAVTLALYITSLLDASYTAKGGQRHVRSQGHV